MRESDFCVFHDPEHAETVAAARQAGGQRRKREATVAVAYDFEGLTSIVEIWERTKLVVTRRNNSAWRYFALVAPLWPL